MSLAELLPRELPEQTLAAGSVQRWTIDHWSVELTFARADSLAASVESILVTRDDCLHEAAPQMTGITCEQWAHGIATQVRGLLEGLKVIEVDSTIDEAILRSEAPAIAGDQRSYYEIHLFGTRQACMQRFVGYRATPGPRQAVPFTLTHEVLGKLLDDLIAAGSGRSIGTQIIPTNRLGS